MSGPPWTGLVVSCTGSSIRIWRESLSLARSQAVFSVSQDELFCSERLYHQGWYLGFCGVWSGDAIQEVSK